MQLELTEEEIRLISYIISELFNNQFYNLEISSMEEKILSNFSWKIDQLK